MSVVMRSSSLAVAWVVLAATVAAVLGTSSLPAAAQGACDADLDGRFGGEVEVWQTNGTDEVAEELRRYRNDVPVTDNGALSEIRVCVEPTAAGRWLRTVDTSDQPVSVRAAEAVTRIELLEELVGQIAEFDGEPGVQIWPSDNRDQVVGVPTWLSVDDASIGDPAGYRVSRDDEVDGQTINVTIVAEPVTLWSFTDSAEEIECPGVGSRYVSGAVPGPDDCVKEWTQSTTTEPVLMSVQVGHRLSWQSIVVATEEVIDTGTSVRRGPSRDDIKLHVAEGLSFGAAGEDGDRIERQPPQEAGRALEPIPAQTCWLQAGPLCESWDVVKDAVGDLYDALGPAVMTVVREVWNFIKGCASFGVEAVTGLWDAAKQFGKFLTSPGEFFDEKFDMIVDMYQGVTGPDRNEFALQVMGEALEVDNWKENPSQQAGKLFCEAAVSFFSGGAVGFLSKTKVFRKIEQLIDGFYDGRSKPGRDKRDDTGDEGIGGSGGCNLSRGGKSSSCPCRSNSFPTGTLVRTSQGLIPIELIDPGDVVLAAEPVSGRWSGVQVLDQWSDVHVGYLVSITLTDGSMIEGTSHHLVWSDSSRSWTTFEDIRSGDLLATSTGSAEVDAVESRLATGNVVWDLDTSDVDTFTVHTGTVDLLVHNAGKGKGKCFTNKQAREKATSLGYNEVKDAPFKSHGELVFRNKNRYISPDGTGHRGDYSWKMFDNKGNRLGTYDSDLNRISD